MEVGLFFGSFNPIHTGHLIITNTVLNSTVLSSIWFVVSPQNPLKKESGLLDAAIRLNLVETAVSNDKRFKTSDVEFKLPSPCYTINTLTYLEANHSEIEFYLIMGSDSFQQLYKWKNYDQLLTKNIIVYQRPGFLLAEEPHPQNITILKSPLIEISATEIRNLVKSQKSIRYLVPEAVRTEIEKNNYYI